MPHANKYVLGIFLIFFAMKGQLALACAKPSNPLEGPRLRITILRYDGAIDGEPLNRLSQFKGIIKGKVKILAEEALDIGPEVDHIKNLKLYFSDETGDREPNPNELRIYWNDTGSLEVLDGLIYARNETYIVSSDIYLGDLIRNDTRSSIIVSHIVEPEDVPSTNDSHSLITYYALAMDAHRLKCSKVVIRELLSKAWDKIQDLRRRGALTSELEWLAQVIQSEITLVE